jgi:hypothetical protein
MNIEDFVKKYVWDEEKTPYFRGVRRLTKSQADNEIKIYAVFVGGIFTIMELISASAWSKTGEFQMGIIAFYSALLVGGAIVLWRKKDVRAAWICLTAPIATALNFIFDGMHGELGETDKYVLIGFCLLWLRYGVRVISICLRYDNMPQKPAG